jgi:hypothetical protein
MKGEKSHDSCRSAWTWAVIPVRIYRSQQNCRIHLEDGSIS